YLYWAIMLLLIPTGSNLSRLTGDHVALISTMLAIVTAAYLWRKGNINARNFLIAWSALIVFTMAKILMIQGHLPHTFVTENGQFIGFIAEVLLLSFALADRINRERLS